MIIDKYTTTDFKLVNDFTMLSIDGKVMTMRNDNKYNIYYITNEGDKILFGEEIETDGFCKLIDIINDLVPEYKGIYD